jgi:Tfp pilus assembly protein PilN
MIKINLLPSSAKAKEHRGWGWFLFVAVILINLAVLAFLFQRNSAEIADTERSIAATKKEMDKLQKTRKEYQLLSTDRKELERRLETINKLKEGRALSARMIYDLSVLTKENVWIKTFRRNESQFELEGRSAENDSISDFVEAMSRIPYVKTVELRRIEDVNEEGVTVKKFSIQGTVGL